MRRTIRAALPVLILTACAQSESTNDASASVAEVIERSEQDLASEARKDQSDLAAAEARGREAALQEAEQMDRSEAQRQAGNGF